MATKFFYAVENVPNASPQYVRFTGKAAWDRWLAKDPSKRSPARSSWPEVKALSSATWEYIDGVSYARTTTA